MGQATSIAWTDHTFNPWWGCTKIDPACKNCYAAAWDRRTGGDHWNVATKARRTFRPAHWAEPVKWNEQARRTGKRTRVFCASMCDVFDQDAPPGVLDQVWNLIRSCEALDWQILTKRHERIAQSLPPDWGDGWPHVWLGVTAGDQRGADLRLPALKTEPARVRFVSYEPALEDIDWRGHFLDGGIHWLIAGAESGPNRRPWDRRWWRSARDQCAQAGVAYFLKQEIDEATNRKIELPLLDGRQHADFPEQALIGGQRLRPGTGRQIALL